MRTLNTKHDIQSAVINVVDNNPIAKSFESLPFPVYAHTNAEMLQVLGIGGVGSLNRKPYTCVY